MGYSPLAYLSTGYPQVIHKIPRLIHSVDRPSYGNVNGPNPLDSWAGVCYTSSRESADCSVMQIPCAGLLKRACLIFRAVFGELHVVSQAGFLYCKGRNMVACIHGPDLCESCFREQIYNQNNVIIAQFQRLLDLTERAQGYDIIPLNFFLSSTPVTGFDYKFTPFETGALCENFSFTTDATAIQCGLFLYHESIVGGKQRLSTFAGSGNTNFVHKITIPARGTLGVNFTNLTGGTYVSFTADIRRSEQTTIEWFRSQRAGRIG